MRRNSIRKIITVLSLTMLVSSCGSQDTGGGTAEFKTAYMPAPVVTSQDPLLSDIATWPSATDVCADKPATIDTDDATILLNSSRYPNDTGVATVSAVRIGSGSITYRPANTNTLALPPIYEKQYFTVNKIIPAGGGPLTITVPIVVHELKFYLWDSLFCNGASREYWAVISLDAVEVNTDIGKTLTTEMKVKFADYVDK